MFKSNETELSNARDILYLISATRATPEHDTRCGGGECSNLQLAEILARLFTWMPRSNPKGSGISFERLQFIQPMYGEMMKAIDRVCELIAASRK
jgi:hypothetical protein